MKKLLSNHVLQIGLRLLLGGMFLVAAFPKVMNPAAFAMAVRGYKIIPFAYSNLFAIAVSWAELFAAVMLILGILTRKSAAAIGMLLVVFIVAISTVMVRGMVVDCGCFGEKGGSNTSWLLIVRNVGLLAACIIVIKYNDGFASLYPFRRKRAA